MNRTIGDIMERDAYTCRYDQDLGEVVALFNELGTSGLVVIDEDRHVVGFISDGDIMKAVAAQKTRSIFGGGYSNMVLYDNESFEEKARALLFLYFGRPDGRCRSSTRTAGSSAWCAAPPSPATCSMCCSARKSRAPSSAGAYTGSINRIGARREGRTS